MEQFGDRLKMLRKKYQLNQKELALKLEVSPSTVAMYETNRRNPDLDLVVTIAYLFQVSTDYLLSGTELAVHDTEPLAKNVDPLPQDQKILPMLGDIACGIPSLTNQSTETYLVPQGYPKNADFCLRAKGDSMIGARIFEGDIVFIRQQEFVENGEIAAVIIGEEATLKKVRYDEQRQELSLFAENPNYETLHYKGEELNKIRILGKVVSVQIQMP